MEKFRHELDYKIFEVLRSQVKLHDLRDNNSYIKSLENDINRSSKQFWKFVSVNKKGQSTFPNEMCLGNQIGNKGEETCNLFISFSARGIEKEKFNFMSIIY